MANLCKFEKKQYKVSYNNGVTWNTVVPEQNKPGDMIEYDSSDCSTMEGMYRWRVLDGQYLCEDKEKYEKEIQEESYDNGATWYVSYPTVYRTGQYVGRDETYCNDKFVGHYIPTDEYQGSCPRQYIWNGYKCVYVDPLKVIKCDDNSTLTSGETKYYTSGYTLISANIGNCVTSIGNNTFRNCGGLTSINIPSGVTSIGHHAFFYCSSLTSIDIPSGVTSISGYTFYGCASLTSIDIPSGVTSIGDYAFQNCIGLTSVVIPDSVTSIGNWAFNNCSSLTSVTIGSGVTSIGGAAFYDCDSLTSVTVNATTPPTLGSNAFSSTSGSLVFYVPCDSVGAYRAANRWSTYVSRIYGIPPCVDPTKFLLTYSGGQTYSAECNTSTTLTSGETRPSGYQFNTITDAEIGIGSCVTTIGENAFINCSSLSSVTIGTGVTTIGQGAFARCSSLSSITIPNSVKTISDYAFQSCSGLTSCTGSGVTSIGYMAFQGCIGLTSVVIPNSVTSIGDWAFAACSGLTSVTIGTGIRSIGLWVFEDCSGLTSITCLATTPPSINYSFSNINNYFRIYVPCESIEAYKTAWADYANRIQCVPPVNTKFIARYSGGQTYSAECNSSTVLTTSETKPSGYEASGMTHAAVGDCVTSIGEQAFFDCTSLSSVTIPNSITSIGDYAFLRCGLTSVTIPDTVTSIGVAVFYDCKNLSGVTIPNSVTSLGGSAFEGCSGLTNVTISSGVTSIDALTFAGCSSLSSVTIPSGVTNIGAQTFTNCSGLTSIIVEATTPPAVGYRAFYNTNDCPIFVPSGSVSAYQSAWSEYADRIYEKTFKVAATYSGGQTYSAECNSSSELTASDTKPSGYEYTAMTSAEIGACVTSIRQQSFSSCKSLTSVTIPNTVTSIGGEAFYSCRSLTSVTIPNRVTSIGYMAFQGCTGLTSVTINATTPPTLGSNVFDDTNNCPIYVPSASVKTYKTSWRTYSSRIQAIP